MTQIYIVEASYLLSPGYTESFTNTERLYVGLSKEEALDVAKKFYFPSPDYNHMCIETWDNGKRIKLETIKD
jgi:hypothetical protein